MLEILSETKDPTRVQPHLRKCFEGVASLEFDSNVDVRAMISDEGERVAYATPVQPRRAQGAVEKWLVQVRAMRLCLDARERALAQAAPQLSGGQRRASPCELDSLSYVSAAMCRVTWLHVSEIAGYDR